jgi:predicted secreted Zn-dependent protease
MKIACLAAGLLAFALWPAEAASIAKSYSYFTIGGSTLEEIENELTVRGPQVKSTGRRHPGATQMEFNSRVTYAEQNGKCAVSDARVTVRAKVILPRWKQRGKAERDVRLIWDTLLSDIKRHEESHVVIAKNYARDLEQELKSIGRQKDCARTQAKVQAVTNRVLAKHDAAQDRFDKIEGMNFENRILSLLKYRLEQIRTSKQPR